jgi:CDP-ribitol ribitolphosphotransferase
MTAGAPGAPPADIALQIVSLHWERVQVVIRARRGRLSPDDGRRFRLRRAGGHGPSMPPTRAWTDGDDLLLRFNVMQGPAQDPLTPGRWTLTVVPSDEHGRETPIRIADPAAVDPIRDAGIFTIVDGVSRSTYRFVPRVDPATGSLSLAVSLRPTARRTALRARVRALRFRVVDGMLAARASAFRRAIGLARHVIRRNGRRILFTSDSRAELSGNLKLVYDRMLARGLEREYELLTLFRSSIAERRSLRDRLRLPYLLAVADVVVIDDYQPVVYQLEGGQDLRIVQLWHASGPFKTVGFSRIGKVGGPRPWSRTHKNYTHAIVSSEHDVPFYAEAFGIPESRVVPTGIPRMDRFFDPASRAAGRAAALAAFPMTQGRWTILFAPTFRGNGARDASYDLGWLDYAALHALAIEQDAIVMIRMHPFVRASLDIPADFADRIVDGSTSTLDVNDLLFIVDLLVTDYSSIVFEYSTLSRPMLFYTPDLEAYIASRDFYEPFESFVPGRIVRTFDALLDAIRRRDFEIEKVAPFAARHFAHLDGSSTDRVIDEVILAR